MKKELEIEHLAAYLPYHLQGIEGKNKVNLVAVSIERLDGYWVPANNECNFGRWGQGLTKPILRPLSELKDKLQHYRSQHTIKHVIDYPNDFEELQYITKKEFELLSSYHYDLFGLLHRGLAVPLT